MSNDSSTQSAGDHEPSTLSPTGLHRYLARTLRVSARHLPWEIAQQIHVDHQTGEICSDFQSAAGLRILELDDYSWRAEVTVDNIAAAQALGWHALRRLLRLAQAHQCEALELSGDNLVLPTVLAFEVFTWP